MLAIDLAEEVSLAFGRFQGGRAIRLPAGRLAYVGSAMGPGGLPARLLRHATRCGNAPPHPLRAGLLDYFRAAPWVRRPVAPPPRKRRHWHVDYLLDQPAACLSGAILVRARERWEAELACCLAAEAHTQPVAKGLGASDTRRATHLFQVPSEVAWWHALAADVCAACASPLA